MPAQQNILPFPQGLPKASEYQSVRRLSVTLAETLSPEDQLLQSMPEASPVKWHLAHTTWFFENFVLKAYAPRYRQFNSAFSELFNSYYHAVGMPFPRARRGMLSRPSLQEVHVWRMHVDAAMARLLACGEGAEAEALIALGLNHEQQHQELMLTDVRHALFQNPMHPTYRSCHAAKGDAEALSWQEYEGGLVKIGWEGEGFAFDNERPRHRVFLKPFQLATRLVTNAEYAAFVEDGGYGRSEWWLAEGWEEAKAQEKPLYWIKRGGQWHHFTHGGVQPLLPDAPASCLSYFEADAFARWAGARLATEAEWEHAASDCDAAEGNYLNLETLSPLPAQDKGMRQLFGDCWEWTSSAYAPYPGFRPFSGMAAEYNGKFMCRQMVLRGGSCLTPQGHMRATYRNFFPPDARWQMTGIRLAKDAA